MKKTKKLLSLFKFIKLKKQMKIFEIKGVTKTNHEVLFSLHNKSLIIVDTNSILSETIIGSIYSVLQFQKQIKKGNEGWDSINIFLSDGTQLESLSVKTLLSHSLLPKYNTNHKYAYLPALCCEKTHDFHQSYDTLDNWYKTWERDICMAIDIHSTSTKGTCLFVELVNQCLEGYNIGFDSYLFFQDMKGNSTTFRKLPRNIKAWLRYMFYAIICKGKEVLLLEHPETQLNILQQRVLLSTIKKIVDTDVQFVVLTNSPFIFDNEYDKCATSLEVNALIQK